MDKYTEDLINKFTNIINTLYFQGYIKDIDAQIQDTLQKIRILIEDTIEKNKELEDVIELMAEQLAPLETPTGGVAWTSIGVKEVFFEIAKERKRIIEGE